MLISSNIQNKLKIKMTKQPSGRRHTTPAPFLQAATGRRGLTLLSDWSFLTVHPSALWDRDPLSPVNRITHTTDKNTFPRTMYGDGNNSCADSNQRGALMIKSKARWTEFRGCSQRKFLTSSQRWKQLIRCMFLFCGYLLTEVKKFTVN